MVGGSFALATAPSPEVKVVQRAPIVLTVAKTTGAPAAKLLPPLQPPRTFTLAATGDLLLHGPVVRSAAAHGAATGRAFDFRPLFAQVKPVLAAADLALCHLEVPLTADHRYLSSYPVFNAPHELAEAIADAGYDGCSTASNHAVDQGVPGVLATLDALGQHGVPAAGTARTQAEADTVELYQAAGVTVGHLSYTYGLNGFPLPAAAPWSVNLIDPERVVADAQRARDQGAEVVVVSLHWGTEYRHEPTEQQRAVASRLATAAEIDLILGHHAHVVQPIERVGDTVVVYGMGNFLSAQSRPATQDGVIVQVTITEAPGKRGRGDFTVTDVAYTPTWVERWSYRILPTPRLVADPATTADLRAELIRSQERTASVVGAGARVSG
jgi:poly-gamma-glutamate synthesis protein (capsule biosynthesis protein)